MAFIRSCHHFLLKEMEETVFNFIVMAINKISMKMDGSPEKSRDNS